MEIVTIIFILLYMLSAAGYFAYLFLQKDYLQRAGFFILLAGFLLPFPGSESSGNSYGGRMGYCRSLFNNPV